MKYVSRYPLHLQAVQISVLGTENHSVYQILGRNSTLLNRMNGSIYYGWTETFFFHFCYIMVDSNDETSYTLKCISRYHLHLQAVLDQSIGHCESPCLSQRLERNSAPLNGMNGFITDKLKRWKDWIVARCLLYVEKCLLLRYFEKFEVSV